MMSAWRQVPCLPEIQTTIITSTEDQILMDPFHACSKANALNLSLALSFIQLVAIDSPKGQLATSIIKIAHGDNISGCWTNGSAENTTTVIIQTEDEATPIHIPDDTSAVIGATHNNTPLLTHSDKGDDIRMSVKCRLQFQINLL